MSSLSFALYLMRQNVIPFPAPGRRLDHRTALAMLNGLHRGVFLLDSSGTVLFANHAASTLLQRADAFTIATGRLSFFQCKAQRALSAFLSDASPNAAETARPLALRVTRTTEAPPYLLLVIRIASAAWQNEQSNHLIGIFVFEPHANRTIQTRTLTRVYGLTATEARLTARLFHGQSMAAAARGLRVSTNTARTELLRVLKKCRVQSHAELLKVLASGPRGT